MFNKPFSNVLAGLALVAWALMVSVAATAAPAAGAERLQLYLEGLRTLRAEFAQTTVSADGRSKLEAQGTFYLQRPGKFRWVYRKPAEQVIVADGSRVWLYDAQLQQVSHQSQENALRGTPALVLSDTGPLDKHFSIRDLGEKGGRQWVQLSPKSDESEVKRIELGFAGDRLENVEMEDAFGQITRFRFSQVERNPVLDAALFQYRPPPGIDVFQSN
jgi:outer membrane lipoprotein carrier protein